MIASMARIINVYLFPPGRPSLIVLYAWAVYWTVVTFNVDTVCHDCDSAVTEIICCVNPLY
jgi:hypothetical protein